MFHLREGRLYRMVVFRDPDEALRAAGVQNEGDDASGGVTPR